MVSLLIPDNVSTRFCDAFEHHCMEAAITNLDAPSDNVRKIMIS